MSSGLTSGMASAIGDGRHGMTSASMKAAPGDVRPLLQQLDSCEKSADELLNVTARVYEKLVGPVELDARPMPNFPQVRHMGELLDAKILIALKRAREIELAIGGLDSPVG